MIRFTPYNLIIPRHVVEEKYNGGEKALVSDFASNRLQVDQYLIAIALKSPAETGVALDRIISHGIDFNEKQEETTDCTIWTKEGLWWEVPWLICRNENAWFIADVEAPQ